MEIKRRFKIELESENTNGTHSIEVTYVSLESLAKECAVWYKFYDLCIVTELATNKRIVVIERSIILKR